MHISLVGETPSTIEEHLSLFLAWLLIAAFVSWVAWRRGFYHIPPKSLQWDKIHLSELLGAFFVFLVTMVIVAPALVLGYFSVKAGHLVDVSQIPKDTLTTGWIDAFTLTMTAIALFGFYRLLSERARKAIWGPAAFSSLGHDLRCGFFGASTWLVCYPLVLLIGQTVEVIVFWFQIQISHYDQVAVKFLRGTLNYPLLFMVTALLLVFVVPAMEESLFRGCLQTWLKQKLGRKWAIIIASIIFSLFHYSTSQGFDNIELLASLFLLGCFLGYVYERQQSLWASIGLHATFNAISVVVITALS